MHVKEHDAETAVGEALKQAGLLGYYTKSQLAEGNVPQTTTGRKYLNSYSPRAGWFVLGVPEIYNVGSTKGTDHASPYTYDTHVPLAFYGFPFNRVSIARKAEPVDMVATLASLLGINAPTNAVGRVLTEAIAPPRRGVDAGDQTLMARLRPQRFRSRNSFQESHHRRQRHLRLRRGI